MPQIWYVGPPRCADSKNVPLEGGIFRPLRVTSLVTFVKKSAGYFDLPKFVMQGLLDALISKMYLYRVVFFLFPFQKLQGL